jgi:hypothetical protein
MTSPRRPWIAALLLTVLGVSALLGPGHHALLPCPGDAATCPDDGGENDGIALSRIADDCPLCDLQSQHASLDATPIVFVEPAVVETLLHDVPLALLPQPRAGSAPRAPPLAS